ncbi:Porphobilinogen deaminase [Pseudobythopirellula maris]|uniref:Porphobilinogen deaminase n=1 Tax=Pseudobythopirellula maris TaxID=2527991 RepID=A0A5C5ZML9_9BACT|nr:hydroxymethylbilane synthase [Pseudobythopirellula maris]TWT88227.1 Porphobilinogen deaminase [Pseudobythopirellula maris]
MSDSTIRIGTRGSRLARWQADWVAGELRRLGHEVAIVEITTAGDAQKTGPIGAIGTQGVFTKEIQRALLAGSVDLAVHSLKDLPTTPTPGLVLAAVPERESPFDALIVRQDRIDGGAATLDSLPRGARVGTGSVRRKAQLLHLRPDLVVGDLRGNVETRLAKLEAGEHDAIVLAEAGLVRLGLRGRITQRLAGVIIPAPGQGALGLECRADDTATSEAANRLNRHEDHAATTAERAALARLEGGCLAALGAHALAENETLALTALVLSESGDRCLQVDEVGPLAEAQALGERVADALLAQGAAALLRERQA